MMRAELANARASPAAAEAVAGDFRVESRRCMNDAVSERGAG